jgi:branched-chain amino acid transport system substrate-binding protein
MSGRRFVSVLVFAVAAVLTTSCGGTKESIRIAVLADCEGYGAGVYEVSLAGAELPLLRRGGKLAGATPSEGVEGVEIGGRPVELVFGCAGELTSAAVELRRLVESEGADIVVGPSVAPLGVVVVEYARHVPDVTFAVTSWEAFTALRPGPNVFRFTGGYVQGEAGLGAYAYHELGWRRAVTVAYADALGWGWSAGVIAEFCSLGGDIADRVWLDAPPEKLTERLEGVPTAGIDGYFVMTFGPEAGAFLEHLAKTEPFPGQKVVSSAAAATGLPPAVIAKLGKRLVGITLAWDAPGPGSASYMKEYRRAFPRLAGVADANFHLFDIYFNNGM